MEKKIGMSLPALPAARLARRSLSQSAARASEPAVVRLAALGTLDEAALLLLGDNVRRRSVVPARRELFVEGSEIKQPRLILSGWAARVRELADGRRQIVSFLLPGDLVGLCGHHRPLATSTVIAVSDITVCPAPCFGESSALDRIYAVSGALAEAYLLAHVTRLGQLNAYERLADFLLELLERLQLAGLAVDGSFVLPMTQEMLADTLGLTSVHINRTIQSMRRDKSIVLNSRRLTITDPEGWSELLGRVRPQVSAGSS